MFHNWAGETRAAASTLSGAPRTPSSKHTTEEIKQQEVYDRAATVCLASSLMCHHIWIMDLSVLVFVLELCKPFLARDVHRYVSVWIAACLVILASVILIIMTGNNCKYHFHDAATPTRILEMRVVRTGELNETSLVN